MAGGQTEGGGPHSTGLFLKKPVTPALQPALPGRGRGGGGIAQLSSQHAWGQILAPLLLTGDPE